MGCGPVMAYILQQKQGNTRRSPSVGLMLAHRRWRWPSIEQTLGQSTVFAWNAIENVPLWVYAYGAWTNMWNHYGMDMHSMTITVNQKLASSHWPWWVSSDRRWPWRDIYVIIINICDNINIWPQEDMLIYQYISASDRVVVDIII